MNALFPPAPVPEESPYAIEYVTRRLTIENEAVVKRSRGMLGTSEDRILLSRIGSMHVGRRGLLLAWCLTPLPILIGIPLFVAGSTVAGYFVMGLGGLIAVAAWISVQTVLSIHPMGGRPIVFPSRPFDRPRLERFVHAAQESARQASIS